MAAVRGVPHMLQRPAPASRPVMTTRQAGQRGVTT